MASRSARSGAERPPGEGAPAPEETRLLAVTADQLAQAVRRDRLAATAADVEIERRSDALRSALLDSVSHDLRTPLASIRATAGTLADPGDPAVGGGASHDGARSIDNEADRLSTLVDSVLDMSRIQSGALIPQIELTPLSELLEPILDRFRPRVAGQVTVDVPDDLPALRVDQTFLSQAITNVLDNAATHATSGAAIRIRAAAALDAEVEITVEDSGPGVASDALPHLFERFYRGRRQRIGVAARRRARPDRRPGPGRSHEWERLSGAERARRARRHDPRAVGFRDRSSVTMSAQEDGPDILLVEDDEATRRALATNLVARGYRVRESPDGEDALRRWEQGRPDLVLVDLGLPGMSGLAVIHRIRLDGATPIIVLSARDQERDKIAALDAGADDYLTKPFGLGELHARLRAAMRRALGPASERDGEVRIGSLALDPARRRVEVGGREVRLTPREYELLKVLLANAGRVVSRARLLRAVWGAEYVSEHHYLHVHVGAIRRKLAEADASGALRRLIVAEPGVGYRILDAHELAGDET